MTGFGVDHPFVLALLPLALAPVFASMFRASRFPAVDAAPQDALSRGVDAALKALGVAAIGASLAGVAGPHRLGDAFERWGEGAEIVILIDRSGSMNETFAGRRPSGGEESKAAAAKRILRAFVGGRRHDLVGVAGFSTSPMLLMPMSDHPDAVAAAIEAIDRPGLDYTNIARGLAMALSMFAPGASDRSRAVLLLSDGAGVIDPRLQEDFRAEFVKANVNLYWLFLRTEGSPGIHDAPEPDFDTPQAAPERHLDLFFKSLGAPYRAFEAEGASAIEDAIRQIDRLERHPVRYVEKVPRHDLSAAFFLFAFASTLLLLIAKSAEARVGAPGRSS